MYLRNILAPSVLLALNFGPTTAFDFNQKIILDRHPVTLSSDLIDVSSFYAFQVSVGKPAQKLSLLVTLNDPETLIMGGENNGCDPTFFKKNGVIDSEISCAAVQHFGSFNPLDSSSYVTITKPVTEENGFNHQLAMDSLEINGHRLEHASFVYSNQPESSIGFIGLGFPTSKTQKENILNQLTSAGIIDSRSFSLHVDNSDSSTGKIIFGGVDKTLYEGFLTQVPLLSDRNRPEIILKSIISTSRSSSKDISFKPISTFINIGHKHYAFPKDTVEKLASILGVSYDNGHQSYIGDCNIPGDVKFSFGDFSANIPLVSFLEPLDSSGDKCLALIKNSESETAILGNGFLKHVYTYFNYDTMILSMAKAKKSVLTSKNDFRHLLAQNSLHIRDLGTADEPSTSVSVSVSASGPLTSTSTSATVIGDGASTELSASAGLGSNPTLSFSAQPVSADVSASPAVTTEINTATAFSTTLPGGTEPISASITASGSPSVSASVSVTAGNNTPGSSSTNLIAPLPVGQYMSPGDSNESSSSSTTEPETTSSVPSSISSVTQISTANVVGSATPTGEPVVAENPLASSCIPATVTVTVTQQINTCSPSVCECPNANGTPPVTSSSLPLISSKYFI